MMANPILYNGLNDLSLAAIRASIAKLAKKSGYEEMAKYLANNPYYFPRFIRDSRAAGLAMDDILIGDGPLPASTSGVLDRLSAFIDVMFPPLYGQTALQARTSADRQEKPAIDVVEKPFNGGVLELTRAFHSDNGLVRFVVKVTGAQDARPGDSIRLTLLPGDAEAVSVDVILAKAGAAMLGVADVDLEELHRPESDLPVRAELVAKSS
jgi:hypothetical protein